MNWLSREEIKRRAAISDEEALNVSIEHWEQICEAIEAGDSIGWHSGDGECALCHLYLTTAKHPDCLLYESDGVRCCQEWRDFIKDKTLANAQVMLNRLYLERGKRYGKKEPPCKKEKPREPRHWDYGYEDGLPRMTLEAYDGSMFSAGFGCCMPKDSTTGHPTIILGNLGDDLQRNAEDLREFEMETNYCGLLRIKTHRNKIVFSLPDCEQATTSLNQATKIAHAILQEVATAKRQEAKKDCSYKK